MVEPLGTRSATCPHRRRARRPPARRPALPPPPLPPPPRVRRRRHPRAPRRRPAGIPTARLRVTLREVSPSLVRVLDVPSTATLPELHAILQVGIGWTNSHLHEFVTGEARYGPRGVDWDSTVIDEAGATLRDLGHRFSYRYDLGDRWEHDVELMGPGGPRPGCVYGEGACPPEDCGGPRGYAHLQEVLADPAHPEHEHLRGWAVRWSPEWTDDDRARVDGVVRAIVGQVPDTVRLLLDLVGDKVRLTQAGRLPRALVREVQERRPDWNSLGKPASSEDDVYQLSCLHALMREAGL
ncbi:MAG TPA: plasmid pRiA4b ORF-3 family protein, partial [Kineosporiaceae bacterium]